MAPLTTIPTPAHEGVPAPGLAGPGWYTHAWNRPGLYRLGSVVAAALPRPARLGLATWLGALAHARLHAERRIVGANLARILPRVPPDDRAALVRDVFRHFAVCFADLLVENRRERSAAGLLARVDGEAHLDEVFGAGRGVIVMTAHLGNWELGGRLLAARAGRPTHVVVAAEADPGLERFLRGGPAPVRFIARTQPTAALGLVAALRRNEVVAIQGDRALGDRTDLRVSFFGAPAPFPVGPFVLARATGAPLVPAFCVLGAARRYTIRLGTPIRVVRDGEQAALERWVGVLEAAVRTHPEQWFNFFDVWSHAPAG